MKGVQGLPSKEGGYWRTEARTPMQWSHVQNAGFSAAEPGQLYLPVEADSDKRTVADQEQDPESLLNTIRALIQLRRAHPALGNANHYQVLYAQPGRYPFAYLRQGGGERIAVVINPADRPVEVSLPAEALANFKAAPTTLWGVEGGLSGTAGGWMITLPGMSAGIYQV